MWRNPSNNYGEYFREDRERESVHWRNQTSMESFNRSTPRTSQDRSFHHQDRSFHHQDRSFHHQDRSFHHQDRSFHHQDRPVHPWNNYESFGNDAFCRPQPYSQYQHEEMEYEWNHQHHYEPSNEEMGYEWSNECQYYPSNEEMSYMEEYGYQQESFNPNLYYHDSSVEDHQENGDSEFTRMLQQFAEGQERGEMEIKKAIEEMENNVERAFKEISERLDGLALHYDSLKAKVEIQEASNNEDMVQGSEAWNVYPKEYNVVDEQQLQSLYEDDEESIQFQEDESNEDVQEAQFPLKEEIEETSKNAEMTQEGEVVEVFFPYYEIVVEHQDDLINTQQQSPAGEEVEEIIQLHEDALDKDALALIVSVMNETTLRYNKASIIHEKNKEEEEVVHLFELPQKELHQDEAVELRVPGTPTPRLEHPQGPRKRLEWKIKHKWRIKPHNV